MTVKLSWHSIFIPTIGILNQIEELELFSKLDGFPSYEAFCIFHKITPGMKSKPMRLVAWVTRDELKEMFAL